MCTGGLPGPLSSASGPTHQVLEHPAPTARLASPGIPTLGYLLAHLGGPPDPRNLAPASHRPLRSHHHPRGGDTGANSLLGSSYPGIETSSVPVGGGEGVPGVGLHPHCCFAGEPTGPGQPAIAGVFAIWIGVLRVPFWLYCARHVTPLSAGLPTVLYLCSRFTCNDTVTCIVTCNLAPQQTGGHW